ncbi:MAG: hypothetical protein AAFV07_16595, partial [Bacteroidota bacterium]
VDEARNIRRYSRIVFKIMQRPVVMTVAFILLLFLFIWLAFRFVRGFFRLFRRKKEEPEAT